MKIVYTTYIILYIYYIHINIKRCFISIVASKSRYLNIILNHITSAWAVDREFVNIYILCPIGSQFQPIGVKFDPDWVKLCPKWIPLARLGPDVEFGQLGVKIVKTWSSRR